MEAGSGATDTLIGLHAESVSAPADYNYRYNRGLICAPPSPRSPPSFSFYSLRSVPSVPQHSSSSSSIHFSSFLRKLQVAVLWHNKTHLQGYELARASVLYSGRKDPLNCMTEVKPVKKKKKKKKNETTKNGKEPRCRNKATHLARFSLN